MAPLFTYVTPVIPKPVFTFQPTPGPFQPHPASLPLPQAGTYIHPTAHAHNPTNTVTAMLPDSRIVDNDDDDGDVIKISYVAS